MVSYKAHVGANNTHNCRKERLRCIKQKPYNLPPGDAGWAEQADRAPVLVQLIIGRDGEFEHFFYESLSWVDYDWVWEFELIMISLSLTKNLLNRGWKHQGDKLSPAHLRNCWLGLPLKRVKKYLSVDCAVVGVVSTLQLVSVCRQESLERVSHLNRVDQNSKATSSLWLSLTTWKVSACFSTSSRFFGTG